MALTGGMLYPLGHLRWLQGHTKEAHQIYQEMLTTQPRLPLLSVLQPMLAGLLDLSARQYGRAEARLLEAVRLQSGEWVSGIYGSARLMLAYLYYAWDKPQEAFTQFEMVLSDCQKNGCPGLILQDMPLADPLLRLAVKKGSHQPLAAFLLEQMEQSLQEKNSGQSLLTPRQMEILRLMAAGLSNRAIADELILSLATIKSHVVHIMDRLGVSSRMEAVAVARQSGWLDGSDFNRH
jgi:DNA-binding CsgD family transcriptional regulator